jgi:hypothetical protein
VLVRIRAPFEIEDGIEPPWTEVKHDAGFRAPIRLRPHAIVGRVAKNFSAIVASR